MAARALRRGTIVEARCSVLDTASGRGAENSRWFRPLSPPLRSLGPNLPPHRKKTRTIGSSSGKQSADSVSERQNCSEGSTIASARLCVRAVMARRGT